MPKAGTWSQYSRVLMWEPAPAFLSRPDKGGLDQLGARVPWEGCDARSPWGPLMLTLPRPQACLLKKHMWDVLFVTTCLDFQQVAMPAPLDLFPYLSIK